MLEQKTIDILRRLEEYIWEEPKRFNLAIWGGVVDPAFLEGPLDLSDSLLFGKDAAARILQEQKPPCGAVGCIAGNALIMEGLVELSQLRDGNKVHMLPPNSRELAQGLFGLTNSQADRLFHLTRWLDFGTGWPKEFEVALESAAPGSHVAARVVIDRIEHFISTGGEE